MFFQQLPYHLANEDPNYMFTYMKMVPLGYYRAQTLLLPSDMVSVLMQAKKQLTYRTCSYVQHVVLANGNEVLSLITVDGVDSTFKNSVRMLCCTSSSCTHLLAASLACLKSTWSSACMARSLTVQLSVTSLCVTHGYEFAIVFRLKLLSSSSSSLSFIITSLLSLVQHRREEARKLKRLSKLSFYQ